MRLIDASRQIRIPCVVRVTDGSPYSSAELEPVRHRPTERAAHDSDRGLCREDELVATGGRRRFRRWRGISMRSFQGLADPITTHRRRRIGLNALGLMFVVAGGGGGVAGVEAFAE